ncbi:uncharacterized protein ACR2FA_005327 [Aphomia sociella]
MVIKKCVICNKNVTKKVPGLECSRCAKIVHADPACSKLSNKQINTLRNSSGIEWSCGDCQKNISRRSSFLIPDDGEDDNSETDYVADLNQTFDVKKLVQDISRELKKTLREEIGGLENSLEYMSEQLTAMEQSIKKQDSRIKELENKNQDLQNKNKNLELRVSVLEQGVKDFEQKALASCLEIAGLPEVQSGEIGKVVEKIASKLNLDYTEIQSSHRLPGTKEKPGAIIVELKSKMAQKYWVEAAREKCLTVGLLIPDASKRTIDNRVYVREALTKHLKSLLYNAKAKLNKSCQFVWCKDGKVCARKNPNSKIYYIRSMFDIDQVDKLLSENTEKLLKGTTPL